MRRKWSSPNITMSRSVLFCTVIVIGAIGLSDGARRVARRRVDSRPVEHPPAALPPPAPSAETLLALGEAMGAAAVEHYTEGRPRVQRLIRPDQGDDLIEHQGVIGKAGVDFPAFPSIPTTGFNCKNVPTGYYADLETDCQVFHICDTSRKISFLCPNGTIFSQSHLICDWWFKVDCASAPALYESSAEYYSNEQKKTHKVSQPITKTDFQQIEDTNRAESKRTSVNVPSTTERLLKHRQRLQNQNLEAKPTSRSYQAFFTDNFHTTQRAQTTQASVDKRRKNLVQLIANNFGNAPSPTAPAYTDATTYRANAGDYNGLKEMQVAAETASFAHNNNRQYLQDFHNKNYRPYPVYTPNLPSRVGKTKTPTLTTLYDFRDRQTPVTKTTRQPPVVHELPSKRPTLIPYTKSYTISERREPYTRPGVSLLKDFLDKEKNRTFAATTEKATTQAKERSDQFEGKVRERKVTIDTKDTFESATKIPLTTRGQPNYYTASSSDRFDVYSSTSGLSQSTAIPSYQERRERLIKKLNTDAPTEPTVQTLATEKFYGDLPNRPGLVVPPSLTPKTLHSLAIYYATALDNLATTPSPDGETTTAHYDEYEAMEEALPALFSQQTINKYSNLFAQGVDHSELLEEIKLDPNGTYNELAEDLSVQQSQNPFATSPQIRELAQVFTHALSAYLQDPVQFRKVLSDIRPTHPSFGEILTTTEGYYNTEPTTTVNEDDDEILGFSDDNKIRPALASLRDAKSLNIATDYPAYSEDLTTVRPFSTETIPTTYRSTTTPRNPFRCCGRISASYTSASTPVTPATTPISYTNTVAVNVNTLSNNDSETYTTTEDSYTVSRVGGFQNNTTVNVSPYGDRASTEGKPLTEYIADTNLPSEWGVDGADPTVLPHSSVDNQFESKKIKATTFTPATTPVYFTETDSIELENEEELQRAQSHSFVTPQSNNVRQGKQINFEETKPGIRKPSEDLEAPTLPDVDTTTVQTTPQPTTTARVTDTEAYTTASPVPSSIFTAPDSDKSTNEFTWPSTYESWQSTIVDPITINDDLTQTALDETVSQLTDQTNTNIPIATTPAQEFTATSEQAFSSSINIELTTPSTKVEERFAKLIKDSSTESQDITTIADTVVEKAKEMMNATTTEKLMNVMKKTKSKTVRRLILLLVQTCDDDHNTTAEASKKALLEALMAVSQKDMEEIAKEEAVSSSAAPEEATPVPDDEVIGFRRTDKVLEKQELRPKTERRGKSYSFDPSAINSLSNPQTNAPTTTTETPTTTSVRPTLAPHRRGTKKFLAKTPVEVKVNPIIDAPIAEARVAAQSPEVKAASDTRALELLRSLYTIAARWG